MDPNNLQPSQNPGSVPPIVPPQTVDGMMPAQGQAVAQPQVVPGQSISPTPQPQMQPQATMPLAPNPQPPVQSQPENAQMYQAQPANPQPEVVVSSPKKPKFLLIAIIGFVIIALMVVATLIFARPQKKTTQQQPDQSQQTQDNSPQPAEAIDVEQSNTSINQDISGLNTDNDFPATELEDKALGL